MKGFRFDEESHVYTLDGVSLPSVTEIINPLHDFSSVPYAFMEKARQWGNAVHKVVELHLLDDLDTDTLDSALLYPLAAFLKWETDYPEIISGIRKIERPGYHPRLRYAGTPDLSGDEWLIDIKSRQFNPLVDVLQVMGYDKMDNGNRNHAVLELKQDGTYTFIKCNTRKVERDQAWSRFRYLLDYYKMTKEIERWKTR